MITHIFLDVDNTILDFNEGLLGQGHYFMDGAVEMLQALYGSFHLYLATNGTASVQKSRLKSAEIEPFFEQIFISEELGCNKPETSFFERCFATIPDFKKEEAVMVGDSLTSDILGGIRAGIRTNIREYRFGVQRCQLSVMNIL